MRARITAVDSADDEKHVVRRAVRRDPAAFEALVRRYDRQLRSLAVRLVGPSSLEDVLQDAYMRAYRAFPSFDAENGSIRAWLLRVVYTTSVDALRRRRPTVGLDAAESYEASTATPEEAVMNRAGVEAVLAGLALQDRAAVVLVDGLGFDYAAAALVLDVAPGTIGSRLHRARTAIRATLDRDAEER